MDFGLVQNTRQEQKLVLTNEMKMSLQLLQMSINDIQECIEKELYDNPILEIDYDKPQEDMEELVNQSKEEIIEEDKFLSLDRDYERNEVYYNDYDDNDNNPLNYVSQTPSLKDYLKEQLLERKESKEIYSVCVYLIEFINVDGFIKEDTQSIAAILAKPYELVQSAMELIKDLEPWGIGAKDFKECLFIQLRKENLMDDIYEAIILKYIDLLADNKLKELAKILGITVDKVQRYTNKIRTLEPKPARGFYTGEEIGYIVPEAFLRKIGHDYFIVMNDDMLPKLNINSYYQKIIKKDSNKDTVGYLKGKLNSALSLMKGIEQRRKTIYRILEKIIERQKEYLDKGSGYLKPMNLKELSVELNLHESTVSRAVKDKYISIPRGTIKLKDLFTNAIASSSGKEEVSSNVIRTEIEQLIQSEDKHDPLSDQAICDLLQKAGRNISRRTIAKYREELGIRASGKRRVFSTQS